MGRKNRFAWLKRKLTDKEYLKLSKLNIKGLSFLEEYKRVYFNSESTSFLIGKTNIDGKGISGLELQYDQVLTGKPLKFKTLKDGKGRPLVFANESILEEARGEDVYLNLDIETQVFLSKTLKERVKTSKAKRGWAVIMSAKTGEIVSSVQIGKKKKGFQKNIAVSEIHEPGSVLKTFSFARAMSELKMHPSEKVSCGDDGFLIGRTKINNSHDQECKTMTITDAFARSLNTTSAELALKLGEKKLVKHYKNLDFDKPTEIDFPGETHPMFHSKLSGKHHLASISFGHGISLSSMQVVKAYGALANGGKSVNPHYMNKISKKGKLVPYKSKGSKTVISEKEAFLSSGLLASVLSSEGTGVKADVPGYLVGGKTGTSQKSDLVNGGYRKGVLSSFVGVFPLAKPKYIAMIVVDEPTLPRSGGAVAGPVFSKIASHILRKEQILPDKINVDNIQTIASMKTDSKSKVKYPKKKISSGLVPNLKGYSLREALGVVKNTGVTFKIKGSGKVRKLIPGPGEPLPKTKIVKLVLR